MSMDDDKQELRARSRALRHGVFEARGEPDAERVAANFLAAKEEMGVPPPGAVVAGYWPMGSELDARPLLHQLRAEGYVCALPVVAERNKPLIFRRWRPGMALQKGSLGTRHPATSARTLIPDLLLAPLLAFDGDGYRLGYGGGFYDRTLVELRRRGTVLAVGIAFSIQRVERLPRDNFDQPLDWIVTEESAIKIG